MYEIPPIKMLPLPLVVAEISMPCRSDVMTDINWQVILLPIVHHHHPIFLPYQIKQNEFSKIYIKGSKFCPNDDRWNEDFNSHLISVFEQ